MLDRERLRRNHFEVSHILGEFLVDHLIRVHRAFDGDLTAAIVLGTIGRHNFRLVYDLHARQPGFDYQRFVESGAFAEHVRPCNAMSVSAATGIPRETVRRKVRWLIERGWVRQVARNKLVVDLQVAHDFADFDMETLERFYRAAREVLSLVAKHSPAAGPQPDRA